MGDDRRRSRVYDEPPSGIVLTPRRLSRTLGFRLAIEPEHGRLAGAGLIERVSLEPSPRGFRARLARDHESLPAPGSSLLLEVEVTLEGGGAASLHLPVTLRGVHSSGLVDFLELEIDGIVEQPAEFESQVYDQAAAR